MKLKMTVLCAAQALQSVAVEANAFNGVCINVIPTWRIHSQNKMLGSGVRMSVVYRERHALKVEPDRVNEWYLALPRWSRSSGTTATSLLAAFGFKDNFEMDFACNEGVALSIGVTPA